MGQSDNTPRYLKEYLDNFIWYHVDEMYTRDMASWLVNYGRQYRDWTVIEGHMYENACFVYIWIDQCRRVLRPGGSIYIVSGYTNLHHILNALHASGLKEINHIIAKYSFGVSTKNKYVSSHYHVLFWQKPDQGRQKRTFNSNWKYTDQKDSYHDRLTVQDMPRDYKPGQIKNKNQLSEDFIMKFVMYSSNRGDTVLDCFGGGFTTGRTALRYGRKFIGFELNKNAFDAFTPTLDQVEVLPDPVPIEPDSEELAKRNKMREGWKLTRAKRKQQNENAETIV
ncbi:site-specific DNA-methyltransferase [bacterium]|nr:site-specific DNA-methyltransferase [Candidatus Elulimicrobium humile]